jgi:hypothetical protein
VAFWEAPVSPGGARWPYLVWLSTSARRSSKSKGFLTKPTTPVPRAVCSTWALAENEQHRHRVPVVALLELLEKGEAAHQVAS